MNRRNGNALPTQEATRRPLGLVACRDGATRRPIVSTLEQAGYNVMEAAEGRAAMHLCIDHGERLAVAVLEEGLVALAGRTLIPFVRHYFPSLPVVLLAVGGEAPPAADDERAGFPVLHLPTTGAEVLTRVRSARDALLAV